MMGMMGMMGMQDETAALPFALAAGWDGRDDPGSRRERSRHIDPMSRLSLVAHLASYYD
jgi:hypothetical protein